MTWDISCVATGGLVQLPLTGIPDKVTKRGPAYLKEIDIPGDALILSFGNKAVVMQWTGILAEAGKLNAQLYDENFSLVLNKLENFKHEEVTIGGTTPARYAGDWILHDVFFEERKGVISALWYRLVFLQGGTHIVM